MAVAGVGAVHSSACLLSQRAALRPFFFSARSASRRQAPRLCTKAAADQVLRRLALAIAGPWFTVVRRVCHKREQQTHCVPAV